MGRSLDAGGGGGEPIGSSTADSALAIVGAEAGVAGASTAKPPMEGDERCAVAGVDE